MVSLNKNRLTAFVFYFILILESRACNCIYLVCASLPKSATRIWFYFYNQESHAHAGLVQARPMSLEVDYRAAGVLDKKILLFGTSRDRDQNYVVVQSYDMDSKSWDKNYLVQSRRFNFRTFNVGFKDQLYMLGDSISYDPSRGSFETFDMFPGDVCHACSFRQKIYALIRFNEVR